VSVAFVCLVRVVSFSLVLRAALLVRVFSRCWLSSAGVTVRSFVFSRRSVVVASFVFPSDCLCRPFFGPSRSYAYVCCMRLLLGVFAESWSCCSRCRSSGSARSSVLVFLYVSTVSFAECVVVWFSCLCGFGILLDRGLFRLLSWAYFSFLPSCGMSALSGPVLRLRCLLLVSPVVAYLRHLPVCQVAL